MGKSFVAVMMGSDAELPIMQAALDVLNKLGISCEARIASAYRTPAATQTYVRNADERGCALFIAAAGPGALLAGTVAGLTLKPIIAVPLEAGPDGVASALAAVQTPGGIPVACMAPGAAGAANAAYLAGQILALSNIALASRLRQERENQAAAVIAADAALQARLSS